MTLRNVAALFLPLQHEALKRKAHRCAEVRALETLVLTTL